MVDPASVKVRGQPVEVGVLLFCRVAGMDLMKVVLDAEPSCQTHIHTFLLGMFPTYRKTELV